MIKTAERADFLNIRQGIVKGIDLILSSFRKTLITSINGKCYVNNLEQTLNEGKWADTNKPDYDFAFRYILDVYNIKRNNNCINTVFGLILLESILNNCHSFSDILEYKNFFKDLEKFFREYIIKSQLNKFKIKIEDILEDSDEFKKQIAEYCFRDYAIQIKENNIKRIDIDNTYSFMARHISGNLSGKNNNIIIADVLDEKLLQIITRRLNLSETMIICHKITVEKFYGASVFQITMDSFLKYAEDLKTYCNCPLSLYEYSGYGKVLSFFHAKGKLHLCNPAIEKKELKEKDFFRYSMLLGKTVKINIPEADMENIRQFVNFVQAVRQKGIFFNEMLTFKLLFRFFEKYNIIYSRCIKEAVIEYFKIININISMGMEYLNNDNFMPKDCLQKLPKFQPYESYIQECVLGNNVIELLSKM